MLGAILAAVFLVMTHHLKEISLLFLEETAPSVLLTCLSFLPRLSRLPHATCNKMLASVLVRQPNASAGAALQHSTCQLCCILCTYHSNLAVPGLPVFPEDPQVQGAPDLPSCPFHLFVRGYLPNSITHACKSKTNKTNATQKFVSEGRASPSSCPSTKICPRVVGSGGLLLRDLWPTCANVLPHLHHIHLLLSAFPLWVQPT